MVGKSDQGQLPIEPEFVSDARARYEEQRAELHDLIGGYADEKGLSEAMLSLLLIDMGVTYRQIDYVMTVEKPSGSGLRLELDRLRRDIDDYVRSSKKAADAFISSSLQALIAAESEGPETKKE